jgi:hypothetical protein
MLRLPAGVENLSAPGLDRFGEAVISRSCGLKLSNGGFPLKSESENPRALDRNEKATTGIGLPHASSEDTSKRNQTQISSPEKPQGAESGEGRPEEATGTHSPASGSLYEDDLPESYGETRVVLLPIDPYLVHAYWEVAPGKMNEVKQRVGSDFSRARPSLRFYESLPAHSEPGSPPQAAFDVDIQLEARNWYVHLWSPDKTYHVDLGFRTERGSFVPLATSNEVQTPPAWPARDAEERYMRVEGDYPKIEIALFAPSPRPDESAPAEAAPVRSTAKLPIEEHSHATKPWRTTPAGPADYLPGFALPEGGFPTDFPNPADWTPPAEPIARNLWEKEREAWLGFESGADSESVEQEIVALAPEFPLPRYGLEPKPVAGGAEQCAGERQAGSMLALQNPAFADRGFPLRFLFDICSMAERALALGVSSGFKTQGHMQDTRAPIPSS